MNTLHIKAGPAINQGGYSFEKSARPVWRDTSTGELVGFPDFADTQPAAMDAEALKVDQMHAPAPTAPRIPRVHRLPDSPDGAANQGRAVVSTPTQANRPLGTGNGRWWWAAILTCTFAALFIAMSKVFST
jgi:hypothetical protein